MRIERHDPSTAVAAPEADFTGDVRIGGYVSQAEPSRLVVATVSFAPGARTPWKVNPLGQALVVIDGLGWAQSEGSAIVEIRAGDVIWWSPGERHWEGATPDRPLTYAALQEEEPGMGVRFDASVTDEEYRPGPPA